MRRTRCLPENVLGPDASRGVVLIMVLWVMIVLSVVAMEFSFAMRTEVNITKNFQEDLQLYGLAEGGVQRGTLEMVFKHDPKVQQWRKTQKAEEVPDKKGFIYRVLGENEESLGKRKEAMAYFKKAVKIFPQDAFSLSCLGSLYLKQGESIKVALSLCQQATRLEPAKGPYWLNLGKALLMNGFPKRAVNALQQALSLGEYTKEVYRLLGLSLRTLGRHKDALDCFIEALKRAPDDQEILSYLNEEEKG